MTEDDGAKAWPEIGDILENHAGGRPDPEDGLAGLELPIRLEDGTDLILAFATGRAVTGRIGARTLDAHPYEAFAIGGGWFVDLGEDRPRHSVSLWLDLVASRAVLIEASIDDRDAHELSLVTRRQRIGRWSIPTIRIRGGAIGDGAMFVPARSEAIAGRVLRFRYSDTHLYDHYYVNAGLYHWYCWSGPDAGIGDLDETDARDLGEDLFLFCWTEKAIPCVGITIEDHRAMRSIGTIYGADSTSWATASQTVGATMTRIATIPAPTDMP